MNLASAYTVISNAEESNSNFQLFENARVTLLYLINLNPRRI